MGSGRYDKIFGIGLPKTGTKTLGACLRTLGFHHRSFDMDLAAQASKGRFENVIAEARRFESFDDWPWFLAFRQLDEAFPNSRFVLTLRRDASAYVDSLREHHERQGIRRPDFVKPPWWDDVFGFAPALWDYRASIHRYESHRAAVLDYFSGREDDLLVVCWETGHGWSELCSFLGRPLPDAPFPHENDRRSF